LEAGNIATLGMEHVREFYDPFGDVGGGQLTAIDAAEPALAPNCKTFG
jgi:hypothetical protein